MLHNEHLMLPTGLLLLSGSLSRSTAQELALPHVLVQRGGIISRGGQIGRIYTVLCCSLVTNESWRISRRDILQAILASEYMDVLAMLIYGEVSTGLVRSRR
ncbi:hypothetical protein AUEXF2481DRAFT_467994 [Aureobasidium subglaciale EXF-2481]|uniref:Secreted protein n=1 Tax=Aureobasidium subglaciale (strain EXF-2481) TaxID=1043005 RepID=A0A074YBF2_AURSE|nr:uncharacterized protein AUEXF2481DRAFT_467994 [Aureobasidium subglaciale EXF-2481]KEQ91492.1 hypothetical protein AUEXF2481DRAFT_467994 [Aureobasidium subglaciale EXF-2481]